MIILIISLLFFGANCELTKQSSEIDYVLSKPEPHIQHSALLAPESSLNLVNLVKYGPYAGYPIQALPLGPNLAYAKPLSKPILNYGHQK